MCNLNKPENKQVPCQKRVRQTTRINSKFRNFEEKEVESPKTASQRIILQFFAKLNFWIIADKLIFIFK